MQTFNDQFKAFVENNHLNLPSIAKAMGLNNASKLHAIANGKSSMTAEELKKFCEVINIDADTLIFYDITTGA